MSPEIRSRWLRFEHSRDAYLTVTVMLLLLIVVPFATGEQAKLGRTITSVIATLTVALSMAASAAKPWAIRASWLAGGVVIVASIITEPAQALSVAAVFGLGFLMIASPVLIVRRISRHDVITATTMWGAIAAYLSLGIAFSLIYAAIFSADADAFRSVTGVGLADFNYFSFVTMTTLGYGDITPVTDLARAVSVLQTVIGQIFLVVVVARVVTMLGTRRVLHPRQDD